MAHEIAHPTPALRSAVDEAMRPRYDQLRKIIGRILQLPISHTTTRLCAHSVIGQVIHFIQAGPVLAIIWPELDMTREKDQDLVAEHIAEFTLCRLRAIARRKV